MMQNNFAYREVVTIISEDEDDQQFKGCTGIIIGISHKDGDDFISNYLVQVFNIEGKYIESTIFYPEGLVSTGKMAHDEFDKSDFIFKVSTGGDINDVVQPFEPFFIEMESLIIFKYVNEDFESITVKLENEVLANNVSHEKILKSTFSKWDNGKVIFSEEQKNIMCNFKNVMLSQFGVEIDYE